MVDRAKSLNDLGWCRDTSKSASSSKNTDLFFPCRKCSPDEGVGLRFTAADNGLNNNNCTTTSKGTTQKILVQYLGHKIKCAGKLSQVLLSSWQSISELNDKENEERLKVYLGSLKRKSPFNKDPIELRSEELTIRAMWDKVRTRCQDMKQNNKRQDISNLATIRPQQLFLSMTSGHVGNEDAEVTNVARVSRICTQDDTDDTNANASNSSKMPPSVCDFDENLSDDDSFQSPDAKKKKDTLRAGDVIEYYHPVGVCGNKEWFRTTTIVGIEARREDIPLNLQNGDSLDRDHRIKRIKRMYRGKLIDDENGSYRSLEYYRLQSGGTTELVRIANIARSAKRIRQEHQADVAKFWKKDDDNSLPVNNNESKSNSRKRKAPELQQQQQKPPPPPPLRAKRKTAAAPAKSSSSRKRRRFAASEDSPPPASQKKTSNTETTSSTASAQKKEHAWKRHLTKILNRTQEKLAKEKRYNPTIKPAHLEVVLKVWAKLQEVIDATKQHTTKTILEDLSCRVKISHRSLHAIMHGDTRNKLVPSQANKITGVLEQWLKDDGVVF